MIPALTVISSTMVHELLDNEHHMAGYSDALPRKKREVDLKKYFQYALSLYPLSLFLESKIMLKTPKSKLYDILKPSRNATSMEYLRH